MYLLFFSRKKERDKDGTKISSLGAKVYKKKIPFI